MSDQFVYFIQADESGPIKIGFTADDPRRRLASLQTGNPAALRLLGAIKGTFADERRFHSDLAEWRLQGEWFQSHPTVLAMVQEALSSPPSVSTECGQRCLHCSFCLACQHANDEVLIAGLAGNICGACVRISCEVVAEHDATKARATQ